MTSAAEIRQRLIDFLRRDLVGPAYGDAEELEERPALRYSAGILFPQIAVRDESSEVAGRANDDSAASERDEPLEPVDDATDKPSVDESDVDGGTTGSVSGGTVGPVDDETDDETVTLANSFKPAAMGLSFCVEAPAQTLVIVVRCATYQSVPEAKDPRWRRTPLDIAPVTLVLDRNKSFERHDRELVPGLRLRVLSRDRAGTSRICTACVYNTTQARTASSREFCQVSISVTAPGRAHIFREYRVASDDLDDDEEKSLALLYRRRAVFAAGHGCAADWDAPVNERVAEIISATIPAVRVPPVLPIEGVEQWSSMDFLSGATATDAEIVTALDRLPQEYMAWIGKRADEVAALEPRHHAAAQRHLAACDAAAKRIRQGIALLRHDDDALRAFKLMNAAMIRQQDHSRRRRRIDAPWSPLPTSYSSVAGKQGHWRVFQLAFVLMTLPGIGPDADLDERGVVDLIWFPTGGGKTEAYLALTAYTFFRRRIANPRDLGCVVFMRYTLRLLTSQQFQRAASLVCACEVVRREHRDLGSDPFSIGLWVGGSLTPNRDDAAIKKLRAMGRDGAAAKNPFQLLACPWCGTELTARNALGYVEERGRILFRCPASSKRVGGAGCPFSTPQSPLPVSVVDDTIYDRPPSLLIGTVDKFAMLAWLPQARSLFGGTTCSPPELIIQDELHLISGPLGSMVGLYESAIDFLCSDADGRGPKVIASTATIRRAAEQCRDLYNRPTQIFPPQGLDAGDSYFARENAEADGRVYVGFLPTAASSPLTAQVRGVAALAQGLPMIADGCAPEVVDPYWTLVQYFSSMKELGRAATLLSADIPEYLPAMQRRYAVAPELRRRVTRIEEMNSRRNEAEIPQILRELENRYVGRSAAKELPFSALPIDTLLATNMISVGVDVDRLGLMMVVTQPKGTSEYIQATSRVGRSRSAPGLVITLYSAARPRDRSHYEQFRPYHEAFYRNVEPTSVTPFSVPALERALHAILVILARHGGSLGAPDRFDRTTPRFAKGLEFLRARVKAIDPGQIDAVNEWLEKRMSEWEALLPPEWGGFAPPQDLFLMQPTGTPPPSGDLAGFRRYWVTPTSMRNVDAECRGVVVPYPGSD